MLALNAATMCKDKQHVNPNYKLTRYFWVAFVEEWPLQANTLLFHLHYNYKLQNASSAIVIGKSF
jgi:hypothetical protein